MLTKKRKMNVKLLFISVWFVQLGWGQEVINISLNEALDQAVKNDPRIRIQKIDQQIAESADQKVRAARLPQISASADLRLNTQLQSTVLPFDISGQNPEGTSTVQFGTRFQNTLTFQLEQPIYHPARKIQLAINNNRQQEKNEQLKEIELSIKKEITEVYYRAIYYREKILLFETELDAAEFNFSTADTRHQKGIIEENEWLKLKISVANARLNLERIQNDYSTALVELKKQLQFDPEIMIKLSDSISQLESRFPPRPSVESLNRPEIQRITLDESYASLQNDLLLAERTFNIDAYGHYGLLQLNDQFNPVNFNSWYPYNYIGIRVGVPIFDGNLTKLKAQEELLRKEKSHQQLITLQYEIKQEEIQARQNLVFAQKALALARENLRLSEEIYAVDQVRFENGTMLPGDLRQSELEITRSRESYLDALYSLLLADLELRQVLGQF